METLPFRASSFDVVLFGQALHECQDLMKTFSEAYRCGRLRVAALDWPYQDEMMGPPLAHQISPDKLIMASEKIVLGALTTFL